MALSLTPARIGDLFECGKQAPRICGWHWSLLPWFVRMVRDFVETTENTDRILNLNSQSKSNAIL